MATNIKTGNKVALKKMALNDESMEVSPLHHHASIEQPGLTPKPCMRCGVCVVQLLITEILIMKTSKHPNIVEFIDSYVVRDQIWVHPPPLLLLVPRDLRLTSCVGWADGALQVAMEYMGSGCLTEVIDQADSCPMSEAQMAYVALEVRLAPTGKCSERT